MVITDLTMPDITGDKLSTELIKIRSDISIILWTGGNEIFSEEKAVSIGISIKAFLYKPILMKDLSQKYINYWKKWREKEV
ncbi:response regulator [Desulfococcaceae bacterium HSG9]|nr:response regulator [Desulfococcaceae bacterium HSG9]